MFAKTLELAQSSASKRAMYLRFILAALASCLIVKTGWFSRLWPWQHRVIVDFDAFHIAAQRVWLGDIDQAYQFEKLAQMQRDASNGAFKFMPWTYPPQFDLLIAPFAFLPVGTAYFLFTAGTLGFYLVTLRFIAGSYFALVLLVLLPALVITIASGQNGFLTGGLIGLVCLTVHRRQVLAGLALGMMVIKPHLAIAVAVYSLLKRRWIAALTAATMLLATSALSTILLGPQIWAAFFGSMQESGVYLERGFYPFFRMISPYATLRMAGVPSWTAFLGQAVVAILSITVIVVAIYRGFPLRWSLGLTAIVSVLISPYAYDYDLPILGVGLAFLLPDLVRLASERERATMYGLILLTGFYGLLQSFRLQLQHGPSVDEHWVPSIGGIAVVVLLGLIFRILLRNDSGRKTSVGIGEFDEVSPGFATPFITGALPSFEGRPRVIKSWLCRSAGPDYFDDERRAEGPCL
jgi:hypothetical protein